MKPSISIDERGVLLHVTDKEGHGISIPLEPATAMELAANLQLAVKRLKTPEGKRTLVRGLGALFMDLVKGDNDGK